ncbi:EscU/YscU/HrcU family type III secretion system export apparatus switch protein [Rhodopila sp.]|uniref:EscU/YscU/HrcU family type III secretion system export apparatus switch protein n=1 Tax=Rhodopila sp. TaxID=2480087 RepID=UPI003D0BE619
MADEGQSSEDRTEAATQRHLEQAREAGNVPLSREAATFLSMAAVIAALYYNIPTTFRELGRETALFLARANQPQMAGPAGLRLAAQGLLSSVLPVLGAAIVAGAAAILVQTNFLLHLGAMQPKLSRVSPAAGIKRLFGSNGLIELVKSLGKLCLLLFALWLAARSDVMSILAQPWQDPGHLPAAIGRSVLHIMIAGLCTQAAIAGADLLWVRLKHARDQRMSKQDVRDEQKDADGNPHIKARIRRIRFMRARKRMMAAVPQATVVVTNPTHYAVALSYDRSKNAAPRVVAKGVDHVAARIRQIAQANNVPLVSNPPLARALYQQELDTDIPAEHYKAVAEIIAYVWRLRRPAPLG